MQRKDLVTLLLTIGSGFIAFLFVMNLLNKPAAVGRALVLAKQEIPANTLIAEEMLELSKPVTEKDPEQFFLQVKDVVGLKTIEIIASGTMVARSQVRRVSDEETAAQSIPEGMRVLAVSASSIEPVPDTLTSGQFVDILGKVAFPGRPTELRTLYRAAKVVSVKKSEAKGEINSMMLALSPLGAEVVTRAILQGKLGLLVRSESDPGEEAGIAEGLDTPPPAIEQNFTMEIIRGIEKEKSLVVGSASTPVSAAAAPATGGVGMIEPGGQMVDLQ